MPERESAAYQVVRARTTELIRATPRDALDEIAPATPEWRVRDVLAHMIGVTVDVAEGRLEGVATDPWTAAQVDARRGASVEAMLEEWDDYGARFEETLVALPPGASTQAVFDAVTHEADIRHALGMPAERSGDPVALSFEFCGFGREFGTLPALLVRSERGETVLGSGDPAAQVDCSEFEFMRASTGRRSASEVAAYKWDREVDPAIILVASFFTMRPEPLAE
jgi:uncharacterized protein (TIGR03083 family)